MYLKRAVHNATGTIVDWKDPDNIAELTRLYDLGLTMSEISERLGCSKNAVCGARNRLRLPERGNPIGNHTSQWAELHRNIRRRITRMVRGGATDDFIISCLRDTPSNLLSRYLHFLRKVLATRAQAAAARAETMMASSPKPKPQPSAVTLSPLPSLTPRAAVTPLFPKPTAPAHLPASLSHRCCWVMENRIHEQLFCDAPAPLGSSWCQEHARVVFTQDGYTQWEHRHLFRRAA